MKRLIVIGAIVLALGAVGFRLSRELERYTYTDEKGYSRRAREDRFLALRRWAGMNGIAIEDDPEEDSENFDAMLVNEELLDSPALADSLQAWVLGGGHLTVFLISRGDAAAEFEAAEELSAALGFEMTAESLPEAQWAMPEEDRLRQKGGEERTVSISPGILIRAGKLPKGTSFVTAGEDESYRFLSVPVGSGRLTLTGNPVFLENERIGESDNASLAWDLIAANRDSARILFLPDGAVEGFFSGEPWAAGVLAALASSLAVGAWMALARRDAVLDAERPAGSDIGRRLAAEGNFFRSHGCTEAYLSACRTDAIRRLKRRGFADKEGRVDTDALSRKLGADSGLLRTAFDAKTAPGKKGFRELMKIFHHIEEVI